MSVKGIKNLRQVAEFWNECLSLLDSGSDQEAAYKMTSIVGNPHWDEWYAEREGDSLFVEVFDLVSDLETPIEREVARDEAWARVKELVAEMQQES